MHHLLLPFAAEQIPPKEPQRKIYGSGGVPVTSSPAKSMASLPFTLFRNIILSKKAILPNPDGAGENRPYSLISLFVDILIRCSLIC